RQPVNHVIVRRFSEQNLSACKHCHCADDERENGCDLVEIYFHVPVSFCSCFLPMTRSRMLMNSFKGTRCIRAVHSTVTAFAASMRREYRLTRLIPKTSITSAMPLYSSRMADTRASF